MKTFECWYLYLGSVTDSQGAPTNCIPLSQTQRQSKIQRQSLRERERDGRGTRRIKIPQQPQMGLSYVDMMMTIDSCTAGTHPIEASLTNFWPLPALSIHLGVSSRVQVRKPKTNKTCQKYQKIKYIYYIYSVCVCVCMCACVTSS